MYIAIPTLAGQAAIAAAVDPDNPVPLVLSRLVAGDGNGNAVAPVETQTGLVNQTADVPILSTSRDGNKLTILGALDETIGGFVIREVGILDENNVLMFVASVPATEKVNNSPSIQDVLHLGLVVIVSATAQVVLTIDGITYATHDYVNQALANHRTTIATPLRPYHIAVKSMALAVAPANPTPGDTYLVAADATGSWAGHSGKLAQYVGAQVWVFVALPNGHCLGNEADGLLYQRTGGLWAALVPANPDRTLWLQSNAAGVRSWSDPFDIAALTTRALAPNDLIAVHDISVDSKSKNTIAALGAVLAESDYLHSQMIFLGTQHG